MFGVVLLCRVVLCCIALCYIMSWVVVLHCVMFDCVRVCCVAKSLGCGFAFVPVAHKYLYIFLWSERRPGQTLIHKHFWEMTGFDIILLKKHKIINKNIKNVNLEILKVKTWFDDKDLYS